MKMYFGKYKGTELSSIPEHYLIWVSYNCLNVPIEFAVALFDIIEWGGGNLMAKRVMEYKKFNNITTGFQFGEPRTIKSESVGSKAKFYPHI
jgi:hypothetical protein